MTSPRTLLKAWNLKAKKQLGQNFLSSPSTAGMIVSRAGIGREETVLEIGAGFGALTLPLAAAAGRVVAVETDHRLIGLLETELLARKAANVEVVEGDILKLDIAGVAARAGGRLTVAGNLPYHISSQILIRLVHARQAVRRAVLMFQKEMAQRLAVGPGNRDYGRISVMVQYGADVRRLATVEAACFHPRPAVDSEVLAFDFRHPPRFPADDETTLFRVVKAGFSKRRKTLKNALAAGGLDLDGAAAAALLEQAGIDPARRAETVSVEEFVRLGNLYGALRRR